MDTVVEQILSSYDTITVVGASADPAEARAIAEGGGLLYVENRCLSVEQRRLGLNAPVDENGR